MLGAVQKALMDNLREVRSATRALLEGVDPESMVYEDPDWRIRDILGHIAAWDREVTKSLQAFRAGEEYSIDDLEEDDFNQQSVLEQRKLTYPQVVAEWEQARADFIEAVQEIPPEQFPGDLLFPWGDERGSVQTLVEYMLEHEKEHRDDILAAIKA